MAKEYKLSAERLKELEEELTYLKTVKDKEVTEQIKVARGYGDLSENSEYDEAKNEQAKVEGEIAQLEEMLKNAVIADEDNTGAVGVGSFVRLRDVELGTEAEYQIVGAIEADIFANKIPNDAPIAKAILGHQQGDIVDVDAPAGVLKYEILDIHK